MALGVTDETSAELQRPFRNTGTLHIFSVSGLHVALISAIGWMFLSAFGVGRTLALFILIPALGSLYIAMRNYGEAGAMTEAVSKPLTGGLILLVVSFMFLFDLDWANLWPLLLIIAGAGMLFTAFGPARR